MAKKQVNPTRMELTRLKKKLITARRGHKLLKDKRDELMRRFLELVKENKALRELVEEEIKKANEQFILAKAVTQEEIINTALLSPKQGIFVDIDRQNIMSVEIPVFNYRLRTSDKSDIYPYGFAFTSEDLDSAINILSDAFPHMLRLAECEKACLMLSSEIEKTRRRVNALEYVMIPEMTENIRYITMKLDENERSTQIRLMKVKDMMIRETINAK